MAEPHHDDGEAGSKRIKIQIGVQVEVLSRRIDDDDTFNGHDHYLHDSVQGAEKQAVGHHLVDSSVGRQHPNSTSLSSLPPKAAGSSSNGGGGRQHIPKYLIQKNLIGTSSLLAYCVSFLLLWIFHTIAYDVPSPGASKSTKSYNTWLSCIQLHFDGVSDASWIHACGEQPKYYENQFRVYKISVFLLSGQSIMVGLAFITQFRDLFRSNKVVMHRELARLIQLRRSRELRNKEIVANINHHFVAAPKLRRSCSGRIIAGEDDEGEGEDPLRSLQPRRVLPSKADAEDGVSRE
jgi:hypothetical protein